jgi:hypothetical protein
MMKIETPWHAEHQLDQLAGQFEHWRQTRPSPRSRIPPALWDQAVSLTQALSPSRVAKQLRLGVTDLKKQIAAHHESTAAPPPTTLGFVEVPPTPSWPQAIPATQIELHRADGARLCIHYPASTPPLVALVRSFLEVR